MADTLRIKRRSSAGAAGAPASLAAAEIAYNEKDDTLYYGWGNSGGTATVVKAIAGPGAFDVKNAPAIASVADAAPSSPTLGQLWFDSDNGRLFIWYDSFWVQVKGS